MNSLIRFLTFSARKPTHVYETAAYMFVRLFLGGLAFAASFAAAPAHVAPFLLLSFGVSIAGASAAQTVRSGASRRQEQRKRAGVGDVSLPCEADLRRAAALGSAVASCAPMLALGQALASHAVGALRGWALAAALLSIFQSAFDVAWSLVLYPRWRTRYTTERDRLRTVSASCEAATKADATGSSLFVEEAEKERRHRAWQTETRRSSMYYKIRCQSLYEQFDRAGDDAMREFVRTAEPHPPLTSEQQEQAANLASDDPEDAPTTMFSRNQIDDDDPTEVDIDSEVYVQCESLDDLLSRTDQPAPVGTRLYVNDDAPIVEYRGSVVGWIVDWLDGATSPASKLYGGRERERFVAMAEGRET